VADEVKDFRLRGEVEEGVAKHVRLDCYGVGGAPPTLKTG
jgi:hypothetical protein